MNQFSKLANSMNPIPDHIRRMLETQEKFKLAIPTFDFPLKELHNIKIPSFVFPKIEIPNYDNLISPELLKTLKEFSKIGEKLKDNPELQFGFISDLQILNLKSAEELKESLILNLTDEDITEKELILNKNLLPYLEEHELDNLWIGANQVLESKDNPDKLRQCLISLRTILEYLIDEKMAPMEKIKDEKMFESSFRKFYQGKQKLEFVKIKREQKIEYFTSKFKFGMLEDFTKNEIQYVCNCYSILCNVHQPNIGLTENQVRSLKVKTGITIWLLTYLLDIMEK